MAFSPGRLPTEWLGLELSLMLGPLVPSHHQSQSLIKSKSAWLHTTAGKVRDCLVRKGILLTQHGEAGVVANWVPHIPLLGLPTLPSPSSWESPASVGHSTLAAGTIPSLCSVSNS